MTHGSGVVTVRDTKLNFPFKINTFVSHTAIGYRVPWTETVVPGDHDVSVRLNYDGRVTTWNGTVSITGAVKSGLEHALHETHAASPRPRRARGARCSIGGLVVAAHLRAPGAVLLRRRRRDTRRSLAELRF